MQTLLQRTAGEQKYLLSMENPNGSIPARIFLPLPSFCLLRVNSFSMIINFLHPLHYSHFSPFQLLNLFAFFHFLWLLSFLNLPWFICSFINSTSNYWAFNRSQKAQINMACSFSLSLLSSGSFIHHWPPNAITSLVPFFSKGKMLL